MKKKFSELVEKIPPSGIRRFFDLVIGNNDIISLGVGEPDFVTPWNVRENAIYSLEQGYTSYTGNQGLLELRIEIANYIKKRFKATYDPKTEILITVGVSEAVDITFRSILNPGDEVILPEPTYVCYAPLIELAQGKVVSLDTSANGFIVDPIELEKKITKKTKAILLCTPSNPTGEVIPKKVLEKIAKLAQKHDYWIITDEVYSELSYDEKFTSFASLKNVKNRTILLQGFSKAFAMTGWRLGYICGPENFLKQALKIHQYNTLCAPILSQYAGIEALKHSIKDVEEMTKSYKHRRNFFVGELNKCGLPTRLPKGAFYCFPSTKETGLSSEEFAIRLLKEQKVAVVPGHVFGQGGEGYIRCCYATDLELLREAAKRIKTFVNNLKNQKRS